MSEFFFIDTEAWLANPHTPETAGVTIDLLVQIYYPSLQPFAWNPERIAATILASCPNRGYSAEFLEAMKPSLLEFFVVLEDGRWAPSPKYFSLTDGNAEAGSGAL